jgi:hypothetical protein
MHERVVFRQVAYISSLREMVVGGQASHEHLTPAEVPAARWNIGGLKYVTAQSRSDGAASTARASGNLSESLVVGVLPALNRIRNRLQAENMGLVFPLLHPSTYFQVTVIGDASWGTAPRCDNQGGLAATRLFARLQGFDRRQVTGGARCIAVFCDHIVFDEWHVLLVVRSPLLERTRWVGQSLPRSDCEVAS